MRARLFAVAFLLSSTLPAIPAYATLETGIIKLSEYGTKGDGVRNDQGRIQSAILDAVKSGPGTVLEFERGKVYRLDQNLESVAALLVEGARGLTINGNGATLLCHPSNRPFALYNCKDITVSDFYIDYAPLPFTQGPMDIVNPEQGVIEFELADGYAPPKIAGEEHYRDFKHSDSVFVEADGQFTHSWLRLKQVEQIGEKRFRCRFHGSPEHVSRQLNRTKVGDFLVAKLQFPKAEMIRDENGRFKATSVANVNIAFCDTVTVDGITSYAAPGMTFNAHGSEAVTVKNCRVIRKPGTDRLIAGQSDGCHLKSLTVMPRIINCRFEALMDDSINVKISSEIVQEVDGWRVLITHGDILYNDCVIKPGDVMELYDFDGKKHLGFNRVTAVKRVGYRKLSIAFNDLPRGLAPGDVMYHKPITRAEVRGITFNSQLKTALLMRPPGDIVDCTFRDVAYGVHAFVASKVEGCLPREINVRNCRFENNSIAAIALSVPSNQAAPPAEYSMQIKDCQFVVHGDNRLLGAANGNGITFEACQGHIPQGKTQNDVIQLRNCREVDLSGLTIRHTDNPDKLIRRR